MIYTLKTGNQLHNGDDSSFEFYENFELTDADCIPCSENDNTPLDITEDKCDYIVNIARENKLPILFFETDNSNMDDDRIIMFWKFPDRVTVHEIWYLIQQTLKEYNNAQN